MHEFRESRRNKDEWWNSLVKELEWFGTTPEEIVSLAKKPREIKSIFKPKKEQPEEGTAEAEDGQPSPLQTATRTEQGGNRTYECGNPGCEKRFPTIQEKNDHERRCAFYNVPS